MRKVLILLLVFGCVGAMAVLVSGCSDDMVTGPDNDAVVVMDDVAFAKPEGKGKPGGGDPPEPVEYKLDGAISSSPFTASLRVQKKSKKASLDTNGYTVGVVVNNFQNTLTYLDENGYAGCSTMEGATIPEIAVVRSYLNGYSHSGGDSRFYAFYVAKSGDHTSDVNGVTNWMPEGDLTLEIAMRNAPAHYPDSDVTASYAESDGDKTVTFTGGSVVVWLRDPGGNPWAVACPTQAGDFITLTY